MLRVGLTGGVASGKSTVAAHLAALGAAVCDADALVAELYRPGGAAVAAVSRLFGAAAVAAGGGVDRNALAARVLTDPAARRRRVAAVPPLVRARIAAWLGAAAAAARPPAVAVVEAALLVETEAFRDYDRLVVVTAAEEVRLARAVARGWSEAKVRHVIAAQASESQRAAAADYRVANEGAPAALAGAVRQLWALLCEDAARRSEGAPLPPRHVSL